MRAIILHRAAAYGEDRLPTDLYAFVKSLKNQGIEAERNFK